MHAYPCILSPHAYDEYYKMLVSCLISILFTPSEGRPCVLLGPLSAV